MKPFVLVVVLAAGLGIFVRAQAPTGPSLSIVADTMGEGSGGRVAFTGQVVMMIDGTQVTADSGVLYNLATNEIDLADGRVRIKLSAPPRLMNFRTRPKP